MDGKLYLIYCSQCSFKKLTDGSDLLNYREVKSCKDCGGLRQFKCKSCGYLMRVTVAKTDVVDSPEKEIRKIREDETARKKKQRESVFPKKDDGRREGEDTIL